MKKTFTISREYDGFITDTIYKSVGTTINKF
jgi:hypothetical protein